MTNTTGSTKWRKQKEQTLSADEARSFASLFRLGGIPKAVEETVSEIEHFDGDVMIHDGDLHVPGNFDVAALGAVVLVVDGDLRVDGTYSDTDDPQTITVVKGNLVCKDMVTAGFLEVHGNVDVERVLLGDYNDCNCHVRGDLRAGLFFPEEHFFTVEGEFLPRVALGNVKYRVDDKDRKPKPLGFEVLEMDDVRLLDHFDRELLTVSDEDGEITVDGFRSFRDVKKRVLAGSALKT